MELAEQRLRPNSYTRLSIARIGAVQAYNTRRMAVAI